MHPTALASCALLALLLIALPAQADTVSRLSMTPEALHRERTAALEQKLTRLLQALPGVAHAELALTLPFPFAEALDAPPSPARATAIVVRRNPGPSLREDALKILQGSLPGLAAEALTLLESTHQEQSEPTSFVQIGPFRVHPASAVSLRSWLTISLLANIALAGVVLSRLRRR